MRILRSIPQQADSRVALTIGNFDGVHLGHQAMLRRLQGAARALAVPTCVLTFEPHPREFFAPDQAPARLTSLREKLELLQAHGVDRAYVCRFNYDLARMTPDDFIARILKRGLDTRWLLVGDDFRFGARRAGDVALLKAAGRELGFDVAEMPNVTIGGQRASSTAVRECLAAGNLDEAAVLLDRPYSISGRVVRGDRIGHKLGFPTANVRMKHNRPPLSGIFVVRMHGLDGGALPGVASLGVRPTVSGAGRPTLEVHVFDFGRDIYGAHVRVEFLQRLRDEQKYADLKALTRQIGIDVEQARAWFARDGERERMARNG